MCSLLMMCLHTAAQSECMHGQADWTIVTIRIAAHGMCCDYISSYQVHHGQAFRLRLVRPKDDMDNTKKMW